MALRAATLTDTVLSETELELTGGGGASGDPGRLEDAYPDFTWAVDIRSVSPPAACTNCPITVQEVSVLTRHTRTGYELQAATRVAVREAEAP